MPQEETQLLDAPKKATVDEIFADFRTLKELMSFNSKKAKSQQCIASLVILIQPLMHLLPKLSEREADEILVTMANVSSAYTALTILNDKLERWPDNKLADAIGKTAARFIELFN